MKKHIFALLLAALLVFTACAPAKTATAAPTEAPAATEAPAPEPTEAPTAEPTAAPTEEPAPEPAPAAEYELEREPGCNQLSIYWTKETIDFDTSDMWIWFAGKEGRGYPMHPCAYGAKVVVNVRRTWMRWASSSAPASPIWAAPAGARPPRTLTGIGS